MVPELRKANFLCSSQRHEERRYLITLECQYSQGSNEMMLENSTHGDIHFSPVASGLHFEQLGVATTQCDQVGMRIWSAMRTVEKRWLIMSAVLPATS